MESKDKLYTVRIPGNVINGKRHMGFRGRNIAEGVVLALIVYFIISQIPFVLRIKIIFSAVLCFSSFIIGCVGIHKRSITQYLYDYYQFKNEPKTYHLRSVKYKANKKNRIIIQEGRAYVEGFSLETAIYKVKKAWSDFKSKYNFR